jgi:CRISPR-associated protein Cas2
MMVLVSYDVTTSDAAGRKRLRRVAKACLDYGQRVQNSVFECVVDNSQWTRLKLTLIDETDLAKDSLRFYFLGTNYKHRIEHHGAKRDTDLTGPLIL